MSCLGQPATLVSIHWYPHIERVVETLGPSPKVDAPEFVFSCHVTQRLERNCHLDRVAVLGDEPFRLHHQVETKVFTLSFGPDSVCLDAEWIEIKLVRSSLIIERVEEDPDGAVVPDLSTFRNVGPHFAWLVITMKRDVDEPRVVTQPYFGAIRRNEIVTG